MRSAFACCSWDYTSRLVLTMEWIDGVKLTNKPAMDAAGQNIVDFVDIGIECTLRQLLEHGYFHAGALFFPCYARLCYNCCNIEEFCTLCDIMSVRHMFQMNLLGVFAAQYCACLVIRLGQDVKLDATREQNPYNTNSVHHLT